MRKAFASSCEELLSENENLVVLLGDIGVFGFQKAMENFPNRVYNIGILEQSTVGVGAGMALSGFVPIIHTIAPFMVERALEQIKIDFGYQELPGNLVSVGSSLDYASLGCTHHCPGDIGIILNVPNVQILVPGTPKEFVSLFRETVMNDQLTYHRLSEISNSKSSDVILGEGKVLKKGRDACILVYGPMRDVVEQACSNLDVTVLYYTSIIPFDTQLLIDNLDSKRLVLIEPFYEFSTASLILQSLNGLAVSIKSIGIPRKFLRGYGKVEDHYKDLGLSVNEIRIKLEDMISE